MEAITIINDIRRMLDILDAGDEADVLSPREFRSFIQSLNEELLDKDKLNLLETFVSTRRPAVTVEQVGEIMDQFLLDRNKIEAVRILLPYIVDRENSYELLSKLFLSNSKEKLQKLLMSY